MTTDIIMRLNTRHDTTVVIVGDTKVGKSALVNKFRTGKFESSYNKTSFESFNTSSIVCGQRVKFTIYDTSGWFCRFYLFKPQKQKSLVFDQKLLLRKNSINLLIKISCYKPKHSNFRSLLMIIWFQDSRAPTLPESWPIARLTCSSSATRSLTSPASSLPSTCGCRS